MQSSCKFLHVFRLNILCAKNSRILDLLYNHWKIKPRKEYLFSTASRRGKNWEALAAVGRLLSFIFGSFSAFISIFSGSSWHCWLEFQRAGLYSGALWLSSCPSSPPRLLRLLPGGGGALSGRVGDWYVRDGGVIALVRCSGLPGPAFVIPPPRPYLPGNGGAAGGRYLVWSTVDQWDKIIFLWVGPTHNEKIILSRGQPWSMKYQLLCL